MSHLIEHFPKYNLINIADTIHQSLSEEGMLFIRTPNMEGPFGLSSRYMSLGHEIGFTFYSLKTLLEITGFEEITYHDFPIHRPSIKQRIGQILRDYFLLLAKFKYRVFAGAGGKFYGHFGPELIISAKRGNTDFLNKE